MTVLKNVGVTHTPKLICINAMANFLLPTLKSHKYEFSHMARVPTHLSFGKHKSEAIADLATHSDGAEYLKWLLKQDTVDPYLAEACQQALESV